MAVRPQKRIAKMAVSTPYACNSYYKNGLRKGGHWPTKTPWNTADRPARGVCQDCRQHIFLRRFRNNASRYAATILIREWP